MGEQERLEALSIRASRIQKSTRLTKAQKFRALQEVHEQERTIRRGMVRQGVII